MRQASSKPETARVQYKWIPFVERLEQYEPGGYHPITAGQVLHDRYLIVDKLGFGGFSTVWLARDQKIPGYVALKVGVSDPDTVRREVTALRTLADGSSSAQDWTRAWKHCDLVPKVLDEFELAGPNGQHTCYASALMQGDLHESSYSSLCHVAVARALAAKLALAVAFAHAHGICHGDIRLKNILIGLDEPMDHLSIDTYHEEYGEPHTTPVERKDGLPLTTNVPPLVTRALSIEKDAKKFTLDDARRLVLCDFGEASAPSIKVRIGSESRIPYESRPPEASFEPERPLSYSSDIWSLAVSIWEILGMQFIFRRDHVNRDEIIDTQIDVLGWDEVPPAWQEIWKRPEEEDEGDYPLPRVPSDTSEPLPPLDQTFEETVQRFRRRSPKYGIFEEDETAAILTLMRGMLRFDPEKRMTMEEVLRSEWMLKWAMPELRKAMDGSPEDTSQLIWPPFDTRAK